MAKKVTDPPSSGYTPKKTIRNSEGSKTGAPRRQTNRNGEKDAISKTFSSPFTTKAHQDVYGNTWAKVGKVKGKVDNRKDGNGKVKLFQDEGNGFANPLHAKTKLGRTIKKLEGRIVSRQLKRADPTAETDYQAYGKKAKEAGVKGKVYNPNEVDIKTKGKARDKGTTVVDKKVYGKNGEVEKTPTKVKVKTHVNVKKY